MSWFDDLPIPGDPDRVAGLARWCGDIADDLFAALRTVRRAVEGQTTWEGQGATAFAASVAGLPAWLERAHTSYAGAAQALGAYAESLREAQDHGRRASALTEDARDRLARIAAQARALDERPFTGPADLVARQDELARLELLREEARNDLRTADRMLGEAADAVTTAAQRAAARLDRATELGLRGAPLAPAERPVAPRLTDVTRTAVSASLASGLAALAATPNAPEVATALAGTPLVGGDLSALAMVAAAGTPAAVPAATGTAADGTVLTVPIPWSEVGRA